MDEGPEEGRAVITSPSCTCPTFGFGFCPVHPDWVADGKGNSVFSRGRRNALLAMLPPRIERPIRIVRFSITGPDGVLVRPLATVSLAIRPLCTFRPRWFLLKEFKKAYGRIFVTHVGFPSEPVLNVEGLRTTLLDLHHHASLLMPTLQVGQEACVKLRNLGARTVRLAFEVEGYGQKKED